MLHLRRKKVEGCETKIEKVNWRGNRCWRSILIRFHPPERIPKFQRFSSAYQVHHCLRCWSLAHWKIKDEARDGLCEVAVERNGKLSVTWSIVHFWILFSVKGVYDNFKHQRRTKKWFRQVLGLSLTIRPCTVVNVDMCSLLHTFLRLARNVSM